MTGFAPQREVVVEVLAPYGPIPRHTTRAWYGCPDCWAKVRPGKARLTVDEHPTAADTTTTGGV